MKIKLITLSLILAASCQSAVADIVFDPKNFSKNTITAVQQVKQTGHQAGILAEEVKQYQAMLQNLKQLDGAVINMGVSRGVLPPGQYKTPAEAIAAADGVYRSYLGATQTMNSLLKVYKGFDEVNGDLVRISSVSKVPVQKILQHEANQAAAGKALAGGELQRLNDLNGELQYHQKRADSLAKEIPAASGALHMLQLVGTQNHLMSDQLTQLIQTTSSNALAAQNEAYLRAEERQKSAKIAEEAEDRNTKLYQAPKK
ncbi:MAG: hypothetical protein Q8J66_00895 [Methylotenera sp.]|nr:hypothetical protein [Methylotenera sp.]